MKNIKNWIQSKHYRLRYTLLEDMIDHEKLRSFFVAKFGRNLKNPFFELNPPNCGDYKVIPTVVNTGDGLFLEWCIDDDGCVESLAEYGYQEQYITGWPFIALWATGQDFEDLGWEVL